MKILKRYLTQSRKERRKKARTTVGQEVAEATSVCTLRLREAGASAAPVPRVLLRDSDED